MKIAVVVDGEERTQIEWECPVADVFPDDIRLARKLKANAVLWRELVEKRIDAASFDGRVYAVYTKSGKGATVPGAPAEKSQFRVLETDHPFQEACDGWGKR